MSAQAPIARHLTWAGEYYGDDSLTVDITESAYHWSADCRGCTDGRTKTAQLRSEISEWAMAHAAACRALPRPEVA